MEMGSCEGILGSALYMCYSECQHARVHSAGALGQFPCGAVVHTVTPPVGSVVSTWGTHGSGHPARQLSKGVTSPYPRLGPRPAAPLQHSVSILFLPFLCAVLSGRVLFISLMTDDAFIGLLAM